MTGPLFRGDIAFRFTPNRLCLDFLATKGEVGYRDVERIGSPSAYSRWIAAAGILDGEPLVGPKDVADAIEFREQLRYYFAQVTVGATGAPSDIVAAINEAALRPNPKIQFSHDGAKVFKHAEAAGKAALSSVARDVLALASQKLYDRVKQCRDPHCRMFFLDSSRGNNRIWCATVGAGCGNKAKKRAFRARQKQVS